MIDLRAALTTVSTWLEDGALFPALQLVLVLFAIFCAIRSRSMRAGGGFHAAVARGPASMAIFYGAYTVSSGVAVALCLEVDTAEGYRVFFVLLDLALIAYLCLGSNWFRNKLVGWANGLTQVENS